MVIFAGISGLTDADGDEADGPTERAEGRYCLFLDYTDCANIIRQSREGRAARRKRSLQGREQKRRKVRDRSCARRWWWRPRSPRSRDAALADSLLIKPSPILAIHILLWRNLLALWTNGSAYLKMVRTIMKQKNINH